MTKEQKMRQVFSEFCKVLEEPEYKDKDGFRFGYYLEHQPLRRRFRIVKIRDKKGEHCPFREIYRSPEELTGTMLFAMDVIESVKWKQVIG